MNRDRDITRHGYTFVYEHDHSGIEGYVLKDPAAAKPIVIISPQYHDTFAAAGGKAFLHTRAFGTDKWEHRAPYSMDEAIKRGAEHADRYHFQERQQHARDRARDALRQLEEKSTLAGGKLDNQANDARMLLALIVAGVNGNKGQWTEESRQQLHSARDLLRETPEARDSCEKAIAVLEREQQYQRSDTPAKDSLKDRVKARLQKIREQQRQPKARDDGRERD